MVETGLVVAVVVQWDREEVVIQRISAGMGPEMEPKQMGGK